MLISASILVRSLHQGWLLSLQKVTLYWLSIDRLAAGDVFFCPFVFFFSFSLSLCLLFFICFRTLSVIVMFTWLYCFSFFRFLCYIPQTSNGVHFILFFLSFLVILYFSSPFLPLHSSSIILLRVAPSRGLLWVPSGADHSQSWRSAHVLVCVWM